VCVQLISLLDDPDVFARSVALRCISTVLDTCGDAAAVTLRTQRQQVSIVALMSAFGSLLQPSALSDIVLIRLVLHCLSFCSCWV
jgi:hypothetical protein